MVKNPAMNVTELVVGFFGIFLLLFGAVFSFLGMSSERGYWSQRDPSGNPAKDATSFGKVFRAAPRLATGEYRAPLRIAAIGVLLIYAGLAFIVLGLLIWFL